jgi:GT2 family glycosyltransferase
MRALMRPLLGRKAGAIRSMRLLSTHEAALLFEAEQGPADERIFIDLYQTKGPSELTRIARFAVMLDSQISELTFRMLDPEQPVLMVVTDANRRIITTDCFPLPALLSEANAPLIEYHVVLETGKPAYGVAAKIARTHLDAALKARLNPAAEVIGPTRSSTCLLAYGRDNADVHVPSLLKRLAPMARQVAYLDHQGNVQTPDGGKGSLPDLIAAAGCTHVLLVDADSYLRPDFWAVFDEHRFRFEGDGARADLVHWHGLWLDGLARPWVAKSAPLLHEVFKQHDLLALRSALVGKQVLLDRLKAMDTDLRSGRFSIEAVFADLPADRVLQLPIVMETVRVPITPLVQQRYEAEQVILPRHPARVGATRPHSGVSVIINYRDGVEDTLKCLESIANQELNGPLELVLVNNGSTAHSVTTILGRARDLFGPDAVRAIDFPHRFNHSLQCNLAAMAARFDLLLMLSNDSFLSTPTAIARSAEVASVPWVGTCGYRIVGNESAKGRLQSLGLSLNERRYLFSGGSPVTTGLPPPFAYDCTFEVLGNTFAAVMLRKDVYLQLDGLDGDAFPTNYNDIDFSFRATHAGFRHVVIGSEVIEHMGRGSREADQDLPIDQRIIERAPQLSVLARLGFQQL